MENNTQAYFVGAAEPQFPLRRKTKGYKIFLLVFFVVLALGGGVWAFSLLTNRQSNNPVPGEQTGTGSYDSPGTVGVDENDGRPVGEPGAYEGSPRPSSVLVHNNQPDSAAAVESGIDKCKASNPDNLPECLEKEENICVSNPALFECVPSICPGDVEALDALPFGACGSVEQIYVANAPSGIKVAVSGSESLSGTTDNFGGIVFRNVNPGKYVVTIGDTTSATPGMHDSYAVTVNDSTGHPDNSFYGNQTFTSTEGYLKMRDNTFLDYHLEMPSGGCSATAKCDVILTYSGYAPGLAPSVAYEFDFRDGFLDAGYAVMGVNMRGTGCSGGSFSLMEKVVAVDGYDIVETIAAQDWVDNVALGDKSWPGISQLYVANMQPPSLDAIMAGAFLTDWYRDVFYFGGARNTGFPIRLWANGIDSRNATPSGDTRYETIAQSDPICAFNKRLHLQSRSLIDDTAANPLINDYWHRRKGHTSSITVPTLLTLAWQDEQTRSRAAGILEEIPDSTYVRLVGTNGDHNLYYNGDVWDEVIGFANTYLKGDEQTISSYEAEDPIRIILESTAGTGRASFTMPEFPVSGSGERLEFGDYLLPDDADSGANESSTFSYSPNREAILWGSTAQDEVKFTSDTLTSPRIFAGFSSADIWVKTSATDMDLRAVISEVRSDGKEMFVQEGVLRASHRTLDDSQSSELRPIHTHTTPTPLMPNEPTLMRIEMLPFAHAFHASSKVRITIAPLPGPDNPPTTYSIGWMYDSIPGTFDVSVLHDDDHKSALVMREVTTPSASTVLGGLGLPTCGQVDNQPCRDTH